MPEGPLGFPRITNIGPFVETKADQEFIREVEENSLVVGNAVDREIATIHNLDLDNITRVDAKLIVREEIEEGDDIIDNIRESVKGVTRDEVVAKMSYWYDVDDRIGKIIDVFVEEPFRNLSIGTTMKEREMQFMQEQGINLLYTDVISEGGYRLAKRTDFRPIFELDELRDKETILTFNNTNNRGIMFRNL